MPVKNDSFYFFFPLPHPPPPPRPPATPAPWPHLSGFSARRALARFAGSSVWWCKADERKTWEFGSYGVFSRGTRSAVQPGCQREHEAQEGCTVWLNAHSHEAAQQLCGRQYKAGGKGSGRGEGGLEERGRPSLSNWSLQEAQHPPPNPLGNDSLKLCCVVFVSVTHERKLRLSARRRLLSSAGRPGPGCQKVARHQSPHWPAGTDAWACCVSLVALVAATLRASLSGPFLQTARIGYATEGALFISAKLSTDRLSAPTERSGY